MRISPVQPPLKAGWRRITNRDELINHITQLLRHEVDICAKGWLERFSLELVDRADLERDICELAINVRHGVPRVSGPKDRAHLWYPVRRGRTCGYRPASRWVLSSRKWRIFVRTAEEFPAASGTASQSSAVGAGHCTISACPDPRWSRRGWCALSDRLLRAAAESGSHEQR